MKKEEFYFDSRDGKSKIHAVRYTPDLGEVCCVLQIVHGMSEHIERYEEFAQFLTQRGIVVTGEDHLGHGKSVTTDGLYGYFCEQDPATMVVRDTHRLKKLTQALYPQVPYVLIGHSMGSFIVRNYACRYGTGVSGCILLGTGMQPRLLLYLGKAIAAVQRLFVGSKHVSKLLHIITFGSYNKRFMPIKTYCDWLSRDSQQVDKFRKDPMCNFIFTVNGFQTLFELISRLHSQNNLKKMPKELPVLILSGTDDPVGDYGKGVHKAYNSIKAAGMEKVWLKLYEEDRHELLHELDRAKVTQDIYDWLKKTILNIKKTEAGLEYD
ncbi:MAG: lysophospholipase [Lachnospiraceae bacterium]|nr:lysophospholipase [Lachnospiraceae bacterium]